MGLLDRIRVIFGTEVASPDEIVGSDQRRSLESVAGSGFEETTDDDAQGEVQDVAFSFNDYNDKSTWFLLNASEHDRLDFNTLDTSAAYQAVLLKFLVEQGHGKKLARGFEIDNEQLAGLDLEHKEVLGLPEMLPIAVDFSYTGTTGSPRFDVEFSAQVNGRAEPIQLDGPFLVLGSGQRFTATSAQFTAFSAVREYRGIKARGEHDEADAIQLVYELKRAKLGGFDVNLKNFDKFKISMPESIGVMAKKQPSGGLLLRPLVGPISPDKIALKLDQVPKEAERAVIRDGHNIVMLDRNSVQALYEISDHEVISRQNARRFVQSPGAFLNADLVDLDDFSSRVLGIGVLSTQTDPEARDFSQDWFSDDGLPYTPEILKSLVTSDEELQEARHIVSEEQKASSGLAAVQERVIDISDAVSVDQVFKEIAARLQHSGTTVGGAPSETEKSHKTKIGLVTEDAEEDLPDLTKRANNAVVPKAIDYSALLRDPYPHQRAGIEWLVGLMNESFLDSRKDMYRLSGALLADDMGLGKTYMTLVALQEFMEMDEHRRGEARPILGVLPVALLENWKDEVTSTFGDSPFSDIVVLHGKVLDGFRAREGNETIVSLQGLSDGELIDPSQIRYALKVGLGNGAARLDKPRRLVLTTYDVLRQYQMSLGAVDWGVVFFDEAQRVKEPQTAVTKAARALNAGFTLMATGTPIENSLRNIYTLLDIAQPGLLGEWSEFRRRWVPTAKDLSAQEAAGLRFETGQRLRAHIGAFMLRRTKEESLAGMPKKTIHAALEFKDAEDIQYDSWLAGPMSAYQEREYDAVLSVYKSTQDKVKVALPTLQKLREVSLHPDVYRRNESAWTKNLSTEACRNVMEQSGRFVASLRALDKIKEADEKVIIFAINLKLQLALKVWIKVLYGLDVHIINGSTKATATTSKDSDQTRAALIRDFESQPGFNIIIMSPLAAGVGLTVVGANHVIHLERHWNPAKEAQATDRVYRIGQVRPVHVYLPVSKHSRLASFDEHLNSLLLTKTDIKNAVVTPDWTEEQNLVSPMASVLE